jgi:hypothetical protein
MEVECEYCIGINREVNMVNGFGFYLRCMAEVD